MLYPICLTLTAISYRCNDGWVGDTVTMAYALALVRFDSD